MEHDLTRETAQDDKTGERGGPKGALRNAEPTRFGDWELNGYFAHNTDTDTSHRTLSPLPHLSHLTLPSLSLRKKKQNRERERERENTHSTAPS